MKLNYDQKHLENNLNRSRLFPLRNIYNTFMLYGDDLIMHVIGIKVRN